ncbi:hypothetical protein [Acinetobacter sp. P8-3-8]|uniref:hypothetical protein n=1 Tax=Acinetobacter sp. P8-3-8 TaxID=1029823 RepID=UPI0002487E65|nr:hypothetical protein [Acinetobacter sp. P8-3-8]
MTTINNSENLIEKVGGIEKAREIVEGAPELSTDYVFWTSKTRYINRLTKEVYLDSTHEWFSANIMVLNLMHCLDDLRTAIAEHDTDHVTDIRNHLSPSTIVKDLEAERHG